MKILVATKHGMGNPYTRTLMSALKRSHKDIDVDIDVALFWDDNIAEKYDIVHVMFPHEIVNHKSCGGIEHLRRQMAKIRKAGVKVVSTCHNFEPHYSTNPMEGEAYRLVYQNSDLILHLGEYSQEVFKKQYPKADNLLLYHHVYDELYINSISKEEARKRLSLPQDIKLILSFGIIRSQEEREMLQYVSRHLPEGSLLWVPSFQRVNKSRNPIKYSYNLAKYLVTKISNKNIKMQHDYVSHDDLPLYFAAADTVLLPRKKILNSGNLPLAFYFRDSVVGPNVGNVGHILSETGNHMFDPEFPSTIIVAIEKALKDTERGKSNGAYADKYLSSDKIGAQLGYYYKKLLDEEAYDLSSHTSL